ncbi:MAG: hypothetical protein ACOX1O_00905 [Eggerthellaceae bacterium]|jgi:hypothetical protein
MKEELLTVFKDACMARRLVAGFACLFAFMAFALAGCSQSSVSDQAKSFMEDTLASLSAGDFETADELVAASGFDSNDYGITAAAFDGQYFSGFTYTVNDVSVQSDTQATVNITVSAHPMDAVIETMESARDAAQRAGAKTTRNGYADKAFAKRAAKQAGKWKTDQLTADVELTRSADGTWSFAEPGTLGAVLLDGYDLRQMAE